MSNLDNIYLDERNDFIKKNRTKTKISIQIDVNQAGFCKYFQWKIWREYLFLNILRVVT